MKMRVAGAIGLALVGISGGAFAADLSAGAAPYPYTKSPAIVATVYDWTGLYIGVNGGGGTGRVNWNADGFGNEGGHDPSGGTVGGQIGYRWQTPSAWVFGLEAQGNWADFKGSNASQQFPGRPTRPRLRALACSPARSAMPGTVRCSMRRAVLRSRTTSTWQIQRCRR
jgi:outer membrane immunogenic protein